MESYDSSQTQQELQQLYHQGSLSADSSGQELVPGASGSQQNTASDTQSPDGMTMLPEYQVLYEINSDIVGWVNIGNGLLSTPVMQRDNEYYLTHIEQMSNFYLQLAYQEGRDRAVTDYISGMSDEFAIRTFEDVFVPRKWHVL